MSPVRSFALCTATSMRPSSSARSISRVNTPRPSPIWSKRRSRSRSPAVSITTSSASPSRSATHPAWATSQRAAARAQPDHGREREAEQLVHGGHVRGVAVLGGELLEAHGRPVQQLVQHAARELVEPLAVGLGQRLPAAVHPLAARRGRICSASARSCVIAGTTSSAASQLRNSSACSTTIASRLLGLALAQADVAQHRLLEVVDVDQRDALDLRDGRIDVARQRQVDQHAAAGRHVAGPDQVAVGQRRADHHVGRRDRLGQLGRTATHGAVEPLGQRLRRAPRLRLATTISTPPREARFWATSSATLPAPTISTAAPPSVAQPLAHQLGGDRGDRGVRAGRSPSRGARACRPRAPRGTAGWRRCRSIPSRSACW